MTGCVEMSLSMRMIATMVGAVMPLVIAFITVLLMISMIFAVAGWVLFSSNDAKFRDLINAFMTLLFASVSDLEIEIVSKEPVVIVYYILWFFVMPLVMLNVIVAILMTSWDSVKAQMDATEYQANRPNPCTVKCRVLTEKLGCYYCCSCCVQSSGEDNENIRKGALEASQDQWPTIYPEGCPPRLLRSYIQNYWHIDSEILDQVVDLVLEKDKGLVGWDEIKDKMLEVYPSLEGKHFELNKKIEEQVRKSEKNKEIADLKKQNQEQSFRLERMEQLLEKIALSVKVDPDLGDVKADHAAKFPI